MLQTLTAGTPTAAELRAAFDAVPANSVGIEEEVMLLEPQTLELAHRAPEIIEAVGGDPRFKLELPASQLEILTSPARTVAGAIEELHQGRLALVAAAGEVASVAAAGVHPFSPGRGALNQGARYESLTRDFGWVAERELVCALQIHVAPGASDRALAVYNAARSYLPLLAALSANAPFYEGEDTGLASVRPLIGRLLPRQGVPPVLPSWEGFVEALSWGRRAQSLPEPARWWWELRPHPSFGTLEFRVPDAQTTVADAAAIAAVIQAVVNWLGGRHDRGERLDADPTWRIEENRWSACRYGVEGEMIDLRSGDRRSTRTCLRELLEVLEPVARSLGAEAELARARELIAVNGAIVQRRLAREHGLRGMLSRLVERFPDPGNGYTG